MLYLTRKIGESIIINNNIELTVVEVRGKSVKLGFVFPQEATILRKELYDRIMEQNLAAASGSGEDLLDIDIDFNVGTEKTGLQDKVQLQQPPVKGKDDGGQP